MCVFCFCLCCFVFFKQKSAYEMRISDWSSDVCSSDLLTEHLHAENGANAATRHKLLMMLDEFPALGRLDFFETSLAFLAGYGVRAVLIAQSLNQLEKAYGEHNAILDNCHDLIAVAPNAERTAKRPPATTGTPMHQRPTSTNTTHH